MAERKRVKGKKPTETMRQRQQRLLREQRAAKAKAKTRTVKTNPTGAPRGAQGPRTAPVQGPSRRTPSTIGGDTGRRIPQNKYGTKGTPRSGPPGVGKPPRFNPRVRRPGANPAALAGMTGLTIAGKMAETIGKPGQSKMSRLGVDPKRLPKTEKKGVQGRNTKGGQGGSRAAVKRKPKPLAKPAKRGMSNIPPQEGTGRGSPNDKKPVTRQNVTPKTQPKSTPKVKKGSGVSGVGPVKSGRAYSVAKTGKSVSQQRAAELRAMRERSKKRQAEMKKKKK